MADQEFEWDDAKRRSTIRKHGIDFEDAKLIFDGGGQCCMHLQARKVKSDGLLSAVWRD